MKPLRRIWRLFAGRLGRETRSLAGPLVFQALAFAALGVLDRMMVGRLAENAISGVGIGGQLLFFTNTLVGTVASAVAILAAQFGGARDRKRLAGLAATGIVGSLGLGLVSVLVLLASAGRLTAWLANGNAAIAAVGEGYLWVVVPTLPAVLVTFVVTGVMRALGDTRTPTTTALTALVTNTGLNLVLINGVGGWPGLGVLGAAIGTAVAHLLGGLVALHAFFARAYAGVWFTSGDLRLASWGMARRLAMLTWPIALDALFWQAASLAYTRVVGLTGAAGLAAYFIYLGVRGLGYIPLGALGTASSIIVGRWLGAGHRRRVRTAVAHALRLAVLASALMAVVLMAVAGPYTWFFRVEPEVAQLARRLIGWFALVLPFEAVIVVYAFVLRAGGDALAVSLATAASFWLVGIPVAWWFGVSLGNGVLGCFVGMALESVVKAALFRARERSGRWQHHLAGPAPGQGDRDPGVDRY